MDLLGKHKHKEEKEKEKKEKEKEKEKTEKEKKAKELLKKEKEKEAAHGKKHSLTSHLNFRGPKTSKKTFGVPVEAVELSEAHLTGGETVMVPSIVKQTIEWLRKYEAWEEEGLFRVPGIQETVQDLKRQYDTQGTAALDKINDPHTVAGLLKLWLRELPEPVLIFRFYSSFLKIIKNPGNDEEKMKQNLRMLLNGLPDVNRALALYLTEFLRDVAAHFSQSKMDSDNLAVVFGPNILRNQNEEYDQIVSDSPYVKSAVRIFIDHYDYMKVNTKSTHKRVSTDVSVKTPANPNSSYEALPIAASKSATNATTGATATSPTTAPSSTATTTTTLTTPSHPATTTSSGSSPTPPSPLSTSTENGSLSSSGGIPNTSSATTLSTSIPEKKPLHRSDSHKRHNSKGSDTSKNSDTAPASKDSPRAADTSPSETTSSSSSSSHPSDTQT